MAKFTDKIGILVLCVVYLVATLGFSIHTCMCERSSNVVLPWLHEEEICEHIHNDVHSDSECCHSCNCTDSHTEESADEDCCKTELFVVEDSFLVKDNDNLIGSIESLLSSHIVMTEELPIVELYSCRQIQILDSPGEMPPLERDILVRNAQFRL